MLWQLLVRIVIGVTALAGIALGFAVAFSNARSLGAAQSYCESMGTGFGLLTLCVGFVMVAYVARRGIGWRAR